MSEDMTDPSAMPTPDTPGDSEALPASNATPSNTNAKPPAQKTSLLRKARGYLWKATKATALVTAITSPIRGTPGNMLVRGMQTTGLLPTAGKVSDLETPYKNFADPSFADSIPARPLPEIPLSRARIDNYVLEPNGEDIPVFLLHGEHIGVKDAMLRLNTTLYHSQQVASSFHHTLKKVSGHEPDVKLIDGLVSEGILFDGPQIALLHKSKTVINNSVCIDSLDRTTDSSDYKAWIFHAAGNLGKEVDENTFQAQPGGLSYHSPRSVLVGAAYAYSSHCGPCFYSDSARGGRIRDQNSRIGFLPSAISPKRRDSAGREAIYPGWGGTSNASPAAAAKFSALMERYSNYLSEEQIFTALCHSVADTTKQGLNQELWQKTAAGVPAEVQRITELLTHYDATSLPGRAQHHFYDPLIHGFGEISTAALENADNLCQQMVLYSMHRPDSISKPQTVRAQICCSEHAQKDADGFYHYKISLPEAVNLNNVVIKGTALTPDIEKAQLFIVANQLKIRIPAGPTSVTQEYLGMSSKTSGFLGSTRGFTGSGPAQEIELLSSVVLEKDVRLTCYNTLGKNDMVSRIAELPAQVSHLQTHGKPVSLRMARVISASSVEPESQTTLVHMTPANMTAEEVEHVLAELARQKEGLPVPPDDPGKHPIAYWRRKETDPPLHEDHISAML